MMLLISIFAYVLSKSIVHFKVYFVVISAGIQEIENLFDVYAAKRTISCIAMLISFILINRLIKGLRIK